MYVATPSEQKLDTYDQFSSPEHEKPPSKI